jgi:hypothetical protein
MLADGVTGCEYYAWDPAPYDSNPDDFEPDDYVDESGDEDDDEDDDELDYYDYDEDVTCDDNPGHNGPDDFVNDHGERAWDDNVYNGVDPYDENPDDFEPDRFVYSNENDDDIDYYGYDEDDPYEV